MSVFGMRSGCVRRAQCGRAAHCSRAGGFRNRRAGGGRARPAHRLTGRYPVVLRPPYGDWNAATLTLAAQRGMTVWLWSVDTEDWKAAGSPSSYWVNRIISLAEREGGVLQHPVVLMHNAPSGDPATVKALPAIIKYFSSHGYRFVAV